MEHGLHGRLAFEGQLTRGHLEQHYTLGVDIGSQIDLGRAEALFRRHVIGRPDNRPRARQPAAGPVAASHAGDAEIHHEGVTLLIDHNIGRLDVAMNHALAMGVVQR